LVIFIGNAFRLGVDLHLHSVHTIRGYVMSCDDSISTCARTLAVKLA